MARNLLLTGGIGHPFADTAPALGALLAEEGIRSDITDDIEGGLAALAAGGFDMLTVYALRWCMLGNEKYAPHRAEWAFSLSEGGRRALEGFVAGGGGLLALHTAVICFDDWAGWKDIVGGVWAWGRSSHPPYGPVEVSPTAAPHPVTAGLPAFSLMDEVYGDLDHTPDMVPLLTATAMAAGLPADREAPALWARTVGRGRVIVDTLGHERSSLEHPVHRRILANSARWVLGRPEAGLR